MSPSTHEILLTFIMYHFFFTLDHIVTFFSILFDYWFPYPIHLYTWFAQQVIVAQHILYSLMLFLIYYFNFIP